MSEFLPEALAENLKSIGDKITSSPVYYVPFCVMMAAGAIVSIAGGFYLTYLLVGWLGT